MSQANYMQIGPFRAQYPADTVICEEVIICRKKRVGKGVEGDPIRIVTEVFTKKGEMIAEFDPGYEIMGEVTTSENK